MCLLQCANCQLVNFVHLEKCLKDRVVQLLVHVFAGNQDEQVIQGVSGHRSNYVRQCKRIADKHRRQASACIQGNIIDTNVSSDKPKDEADKASASICDITDFEEPKLQLRTPMKRKVVAEGSKVVETAGICKILLDITQQKKYKKIKVKDKSHEVLSSISCQNSEK